MLFKKPEKHLLCQKPIYHSIAELVQIATNHPELINPANYSDDEYYPEDKLDAIDHIAEMMGQQASQMQVQQPADVQPSVTVESPSEGEKTE